MDFGESKGAESNRNLSLRASHIGLKIIKLGNRGKLLNSRSN